MSDFVLLRHECRRCAEWKPCVDTIGGDGPFCGDCLRAEVDYWTAELRRYQTAVQP